eukprot:3281151-Pleurochrysis_carterae.AAC.2
MSCPPSTSVEISTLSLPLTESTLPAAAFCTAAGTVFSNSHARPRRVKRPSHCWAMLGVRVGAA